MKVLLLTKYDKMAASSRLRCMQFITYFKDHGVSVTDSHLLNSQYLRKMFASQRKPFFLLFNAYVSRFLTLFKVKKFDLLWIQIELFPKFPSFFEWLLMSLGVRYVVDYDDAIFHDYDKSSSFIVRKLLKHKIDRVMRYATVVVAGNEYIAARARSAGAKQVIILPTVIDLNHYKIEKNLLSSNKQFIVGWIGTTSTVKYLNDIIPLLEQMQKRIPLMIKVIGVSLRQIIPTSLNIECIPWDEDTEVREIYSIDVGIMPLRDTCWERGKCGYKLIQYMACSKPIIASPVGINREIVEHNVNGFLASSDQEWVYGLETLFHNPTLANFMGKQGCSKVERCYSYQYAAPILLNLFNDLYISAV